MSDAWSKLESGSTIETGDAWLHLVNQRSGGIGQVISNIDGTIIEESDLICTVGTDNYIGAVVTEDIGCKWNK